MWSEAAPGPALRMRHDREAGLPKGRAVFRNFAAGGGAGPAQLRRGKPPSKEAFEPSEERRSRALNPAGGREGGREGTDSGGSQDPPAGTSLPGAEKLRCTQATAKRASQQEGAWPDRRGEGLVGTLRGGGGVLRILLLARCGTPASSSPRSPPLERPLRLLPRGPWVGSAGAATCSPLGLPPRVLGHRWQTPLLRCDACPRAAAELPRCGAPPPPPLQRHASPAREGLSAGCLLRSALDPS